MKQIAFIGIAAALVAGCWAKPVTREDRRAVSKAMASRPVGTIASDRELAMADQDQTMVCRDEMVTGSHIATRHCRTARQIADEEAVMQSHPFNPNCSDPKVCAKR